MNWPGAWPSHELSEWKRRLADLRKSVDERKSEDPDVIAALCRFLVVRSCGHIEFTFEEAFCSYAASRSSPAIATFVRSQFFRGSNPTPTKIHGILRKLDTDLADRFNSFMDEDDQSVKRELSLLVDRRNKIAHGQNENVATRKAVDLASLAERVGDWMLIQLDPRN